MHLTPQQREQVRQAQVAGEQRVTIQLSAEKKRDRESAVEQETADKDTNIAHICRIQAAAAKLGFFGDVRRAIIVARRPVDKLAKEIGVDPRLLSDFRSGDAELPAAALDRLIQTLGLRLMAEIPR